MKLPMRISLAASVILMLVLGAMLLLQYPPDKFSFYPKCHLHQLTGLLCPGCGSTRCLIALMHGQFGEAFRKNILAFVALPTLGVYAIFWSLNWLTGRPARWQFRIKPWIGACLIIVLITFGVLRNLPWYPFTLLAPH